MRLMLALRCFARVLFDADFGNTIQELDDGASAPQAELPPPAGAPAVEPPPAETGRSDAIALLATLQREARFVDLVSESLDGYSDAQIGAAAREVLSDCGKVLDRVFALAPVADVAEGEPYQAPADYDTRRLRLTGNLSQQPPVTGTLVHAGWVATKCEIASWTGSPDAALVVAPAEIEVT